jgi:hypothetical protein
VSKVEGFSYINSEIMRNKNNQDKFLRLYKEKANLMKILKIQNDVILILAYEPTGWYIESGDTWSKLVRKRVKNRDE